MNRRNYRDNLNESTIDKLRNNIRVATRELTDSGLFRLSLIIYNRKSFGGEIILLVSKSKLNIRYIKDRGDLDFWCELKWEEPSDKFFHYSSDFEFYAESTLMLKEELGLSSTEKEFVTNPESWFNIEYVLNAADIEPIQKANNFINFISITSKVIKTNLSEIMRAFDEEHRDLTVRKVKEQKGKALKEFYHSVGQKIEDSAINNIVGLDNTKLK